MSKNKRQDKFSDVPLEKGTRLLSERKGTLGSFDILYQKWAWDGITAESIIFLSADVSDMSDDELKTLVSASPRVQPGSEFTVNDRSGKYTFVNFNFRY